MSEEKTTFVLCLENGEQSWEKVVDIPMSVGTKIVPYHHDQSVLCDSCSIQEFVVSNHKFFATGNVLEMELKPLEMGGNKSNHCCDAGLVEDFLAAAEWYKVRVPSQRAV